MAAAVTERFPAVKRPSGESRGAGGPRCAARLDTRGLVRLFHLYRPRVPSVRAQSVQVVHTCHALAARGHEVTLLADRADEADPTRALAAYGLDSPPGLHLEIAPTSWPPYAGLSFRWGLSRWCRGAGPDAVGSASVGSESVGSASNGQRSVVYARAKRYVQRVPRHIPVVLEVHEVDSELARERGEDPSALVTLEARVLERAAGVVANCAGTLSLLQEVHRLKIPAVVIHNATRADRAVQRHPAPAPVVGYTGSPRSYKGLHHVFASMGAWPAGVTLELVGGIPDGTLPPGVVARPAVPYGELPAILARYHALLLPLDDNLFGRSLTNPLKLWDYLATGIPIVAADLPGIVEVGGSALHTYRPGDAASLADAVRRALAAGSAVPRLRTWDDRAAEIEDFLRSLPGLT